VQTKSTSFKSNSSRTRISGLELRRVPEDAKPKRVRKGAEQRLGPDAGIETVQIVGDSRLGP
jgi:hypothetical protein